MNKPPYQLRVELRGHKWLATMIAQVQDGEILYSTPKKILRDLEMTFMDLCVARGLKFPEEVNVEAQLELFGGATVIITAFVVKEKRKVL